MTLFSLAMLLASPTPVRAEMSVEEYKAALKLHVHEVADPMLEILGKKRVRTLRGIIGKCRNSIPYKSCMNANKPADCKLALRCPFTNTDEQKLVKPNNELMTKRYEDLKPSFNDKLQGWRRRFAIGTLNKLVNQHNALAHNAMPSLENIQSMFGNCGTIDDNPGRALISCLYDHVGLSFEAAAKEIEARRETLNTLVNKDLMERIDGFKDTVAPTPGVPEK